MVDRIGDVFSSMLKDVLKERVGDPNSIYKQKISSENDRIIQEMSKNKNWDSSDFKKINLTLSKLGDGVYFPATKMPDSIHLQSLKNNVISVLQKNTSNDGKEHGITVLADFEKEALVTGKETVGTDHSVQIDLKTWPGKEKVQKPIMMIHTHPIFGGSITAHGFSGQDYISLLQNRSLRCMAMAYGDTVLMALKTTVTPDNNSVESITRKINNAEKDFVKFRSINESLGSVIEFNKNACLENGLSLYVATKESRDLFTKVNIAK